MLNSSPWISEEPIKKRIPSIRKTLKKSPGYNEIHEPIVGNKYNAYEEIQSQELNSIEEKGNESESRINDVIRKMSLIDDNDGSSLANFNPISYPRTTINKDDEMNTILPQEYNNMRRHTENSNFSADNSNKLVNSTGNLNEVYDEPLRPYYASTLGVSKNGTDNKVIDRLGYIVHLLEELQNEKTNNILEEYVLYVLLGAFIIYIVDSFSRGGKYIR